MGINHYQTPHYLVVFLIASLTANEVVLISDSPTHSPPVLAHLSVLNTPPPSTCPGSSVGKKLSLPKRCW